MHISPQVGECDKFLLVESGIQLKEFGIPQTIGIQNPGSTDKYWNPVPGVRNPYRGIQIPTLSWITSAMCRGKQDRSLMQFIFPSLPFPLRLKKN